jgi:hypothetical protein
VCDASVFQRTLLGWHRNVDLNTRSKWHKAPDAGEMAQSVTCSPCKQEDMSSILSFFFFFKPSVLVRNCSPGTREAEFKKGWTVPKE